MNQISISTLINHYSTLFKQYVRQPVFTTQQLNHTLKHILLFKSAISHQSIPTPLHPYFTTYIQYQAYLHQVLQHQNKLTNALHVDLYLLVEIFISFKELTDTFHHQAYLTSKITSLNASKPLLLRCLKLAQPQPKLTLDQPPYSTLLEITLHKLLKYHLRSMDHQEATIVLAALDEFQLLLQLYRKQNQKILHLLTLCQHGINVLEWKNLAMLSRIFKACNQQNNLLKIAQQVPNIKQQPDLQSLTTLFNALTYTHSVSDTLKYLADRIYLLIDEKTNKKDLIIILITLQRFNNQSLALRVYQFIDQKDLDQQDLLALVLSRIKYGEQFDSLLDKINIKHMSVIMLTLQKYNLRQFQKIKEKYHKNLLEMADRKNIINLIVIYQDEQLKGILVEKFIDKLDLIEYHQVVQYYPDLKAQVLQQIMRNEYFDIRQLSSLLLQLDSTMRSDIDAPNFMEKLVKQCEMLVEKHISSARGFGNVIYLASKHTKGPIALNSECLKQAIESFECVELLNVIKGLDNLRLLDSEYRGLIDSQFRECDREKLQRYCIKMLNRPVLKQFDNLQRIISQ